MNKLNHSVPIWKIYVDNASAKNGDTMKVFQAWLTQILSIIRHTVDDDQLIDNIL